MFIMEQSKNKVYDENFKKTMVELYESGQKVQDLVSEYGVSDAAIYTWIKRYGTVQGKTKEEPFSYDDYLKLQKEMKRMKEENEILKKAMAIFARN